MNDKKNESKTANHLSIFIKFAAGLTIFSITFPFIVNHFFNDWTKSGTFGETFGALDGLFSGLALAGVIVTILIQKSELENQRLELQLQRTEMQQTRKEFLINRTTNLVYSQLDRFEKCLNDLIITHNGETYKGNDAISFLDENQERVYKPYDKPEEVYRAEMKESIIKFLKIYAPNKSKIEKFAHNAYNSVEVLKRLIYKTELEIEELNDLKKLFFVNLGFINMGVIERISEVAENELEYIEVDDYIKNGLDIGQLQRANIFLKSINEFYNQNLTKDNFVQLKSKWIESRGKEE